MGDDGMRLTGNSLVRLMRLGRMRLTRNYLLVSLRGESNQEKHAESNVGRSDQSWVSFLSKQFG
jgi:hypothetical protein